jgi:Asp-tRNA(Asn)/Glu-tRNA(Gln) amidotransferase C subunit
MTPKQGQPPLPPPPLVGDEEDECISNKEVHTMMKAMTELFTKNQQSTYTTLEQVECSIVEIIDQVDALETGLPLTNQAKLPDETREDDYE